MAKTFIFHGFGGSCHAIHAFLFHISSRSSAQNFPSLAPSVAFGAQGTAKIFLDEMTSEPRTKTSYLENIVYLFLRQLWLFLGVKLMGINSNLFSRYFPLYWLLNRDPYFMLNYSPHITGWAFIPYMYIYTLNNQGFYHCSSKELYKYRSLEIMSATINPNHIKKTGWS